MPDVLPNGVEIQLVGIHAAFNQPESQHAPPGRHRLFQKDLHPQRSGPWAAAGSQGFLRQRVEPLILFAKEFRGTHDDGAGARVELRFQQGQDPVPDEVAEVSHVAVAPVLAPVQTMSPQEIDRVLMPHIQHRPDDDHAVPARDVRYAAQALRTGAARQPQENGLRLVIGGVSRGHAIGAGIARRGGKKVIPRLPGRHLHRDALFLREERHIHSRRDGRQTETPGQLANEPLIRIGRAAANPVVEVSEDEVEGVTPAKVMERVRQRHGVRAAGHRDQHARSPAQETAFHNGLLDGTEHIVPVPVVILVERDIRCEREGGPGNGEYGLEQIK